MESHTRVEDEKFITTYTMKMADLGVAFDRTSVSVQQLRESLQKQMRLMELEAFYGKPRPCPYAGDPSFGSM